MGHSGGVEGCGGRRHGILPARSTCPGQLLVRTACHSGTGWSAAAAPHRPGAGAALAGPGVPAGREHDPAPDLYKDQKGLPQPPYVPGLEVAGTVRALGDGVEGLRVGEPVVTLSGTSAEGRVRLHRGRSWSLRPSASPHTRGRSPTRRPRSQSSMPRTPAGDTPPSTSNRASPDCCRPSQWEPL
ncbi:alcohol dehydrogenase catalytic domain-containing protein [Streptomyces antibioticus]|uniref:alcohol dehydrogenase catalytic domain-containing protein n=1 Tax=Streptomyces antibioticus TaxID=1890 RepID=UPI003F4D3324